MWFVTSQAERNRHLRIAAAQGNVDATLHWMRRGANPLAFSPKHGMTSLHIATVGLHVDIVQAILQRHPEACTCRDAGIGATALHICVEQQKDTLQMVDLFLRAEPRVVHVTRRDNGATALHVACGHGNTALVAKLLAAGSNVHASRLDGATPLWLASCHGHWRTVQILLEHSTVSEATGTRPTASCQVHRPNFQGKTPLYVAVAHTTRDHQKTASYLMQHICHTITTPVALLWQPTNAELNAWTPLHVACREGNTPAVRALLECLQQHHTTTTDRVNDSGGGDTEQQQQQLVNVRDAFGWTPLMLACCNGRVAIVRLLLRWGARLDITNVQGHTAIHLAVEFLDVLFVLLRYHEGLSILMAWSTC
uniref:Uncharacterized protein n=1 Tax=Amphora coffeiformis TaxID=265554 RepID=A0A7S3P379_9STRA|mmetsp:Transcript_9396/g.17928  ORF Transcript_9396/g.17928 Transcript_9396/m.17928 type:complete len:366 (+) Transcript_9396:160-1257(+)